MDANTTVPYISMLGDKQPESSVFTLMFTTGSSSTLVIIWLRFKQIEDLLVQPRDITPSEPPWLHKMNLITFWFGFVMCVGAIVGACFQLNGSLKFIHLLGAGVLFLFGLIYVITSTVLCCYLQRLRIEPGAKHGLCVLRAVLASVCAACLLVVLLRLHSDVFDLPIDHTFMICRAVCQWIGTISLNGYIFSFFYEFRRLRCFFTFMTLTKQQEEAENQNTAWNISRVMFLCIVCVCKYIVNVIKIFITFYWFKFGTSKTY